MKASGRHGWLRTVSHAGWPFSTLVVGIVLRTSSEGCSASCRMLLTPAFATGWKFHPPVWLGVSMIRRIRDPARKTCSNGNTSIRTRVGLPGSSGSASASRWVCTGMVAVLARSSSLRWEAVSQPRFT